ncbi:MAG: hypothetical protein AAFZ80_06155 [Cyanobacteria bacterium P01_A01_bin.105]
MVVLPAEPAAHQLQQRLQQGLPAPLWVALQQVATAAYERGWQLYLVGGAVRDLLLTPAGQLLPLKDIDLVVEGHGEGPEAPPLAGAGVALAQVIQAQDPRVKVQVHGQFQTAALGWPQDSGLGPLTVDIATARTESYPYPAANPDVAASSIQPDLYRRDFTINAMAMRLTPPQPGQLLDVCGGWRDLQRRHIQVLHADSVIDDPTRIFRAVRFAVRLGFELAPWTTQLIRDAIASGIYPELRRTHSPQHRLPALETRLGAELKLLLSTPYWRDALDQLQQLGALICLQDDLALTPELRRQLGRLDRWYGRFEAGVPIGIARWQLLLEGLLASVGPAGVTAAQALGLPLDSQRRLAQLPSARAQLLADLSPPLLPSELDHRLQPFSPVLLWLVAVRSDRQTGAKIWRYLCWLRPVILPLNGHDLRVLGYVPGPQFKAMLADLRAAWLDDQVCDRASAVSFIRQRYPQPPSP